MSNAENDVARGGLRSVVLYTGAGDVLRVDRLAETPPLRDDVKHYKAGDGTKRVRRRERERLFQLVRASDIATVQRWRDAGKRIGAVGLGPQALLWRELVPVLLEEAPGARGELGGKRLRMYTGLVDAAVARSADLLAGTEKKGGGWEAALPLAKGEIIEARAPAAGDAYTSIEALAHSGEVLAYKAGQLSEDRDEIVALLGLPERTHAVRVRAAEGSATRPRLAMIGTRMVVRVVMRSTGGLLKLDFPAGAILREEVVRLERFGKTYSYKTYEPTDLLAALIERVGPGTLRLST